MSAKSFNPKAYLAQLTEQPGVYRMIDSSGTVIYVGKAKNLKNRVSSYFNKSDHSRKTQVMVKQISDIEVTVTNTETEALLLENHYIKKLKPRYNVLFRDDKTYPYIFLSQQQYPRLGYHRGAKKQKGDYFGPFPSAGAAKQSLSMLQKLFKVRQCEDSVFANRSRPCLQYQIKRCKAPCVDYVSQDEYDADVQLTRLFYQGKSEQVVEQLQGKMESSAEQLDFEQAAKFRDQIAMLRRVTQKQVISGQDIDIDVFAFAQQAGINCAVVLFVRNGQVMGSNSYFPKSSSITEQQELMESFLLQFYLSKHQVPKEIIVNSEQLELDIVEAAIGEIAKRKVRVSSRVRSTRADWLALAVKNCEQALNNKLSMQVKQADKVLALAQELALDQLPTHMECFDISHTMGESTIASCVVFKEGAPERASYRRFNIKDVKSGDDYAAIEQAVYRRYSRQVKEANSLPDLVLIDGGKGQLKAALKALDNIGLSLPIISVAKGTERKLGMEQIFFPGNPIAKILAESSPALHLIQHIRDESHRFAIAGHRGKRAKSRNKSWLEEIPGVGPKKRQQLLKHFGGLRNIEQAALDDLKKVSGIDTQLAEKIYNYLHEA